MSLLNFRNSVSPAHQPVADLLFKYQHRYLPHLNSWRSTTSYRNSGSIFRKWGFHFFKMCSFFFADRSASLWDYCPRRMLYEPGLRWAETSAWAVRSGNPCLSDGSLQANGAARWCANCRTCPLMAPTKNACVRPIICFPILRGISFRRTCANVIHNFRFINGRINWISLLRRTRPCMCDDVWRKRRRPSRPRLRIVVEINTGLSSI